MNILQGSMCFVYLGQLFLWNAWCLLLGCDLSWNFTVTLCCRNFKNSITPSLDIETFLMQKHSSLWNIWRHTQGLVYFHRSLTPDDEAREDYDHKTTILPWRTTWTWSSWQEQSFHDKKQVIDWGTRCFSRRQGNEPLDQSLMHHFL